MTDAPETSRSSASTGIDWFADAADPRWRGWWQRTAPSAELQAARDRFGRLTAVLNSGTPCESGEWAAMLKAASEALLSALEHDFERDDDRLTAASALHAGVNRELATRNIPVRCSMVFPGARFDPDTMEAVETLSGNRFVVHSVLSWLVRNVAEARPKVATRARVVTA